MILASEKNLSKLLLKFSKVERADIDVDKIYRY